MLLSWHIQTSTSPFIVDTDASDTGMGADLSQIQDGKERVIAYAAKSFTKPQRNYSTTRKELLALVWGIEHFEPYLLGRSFKARTDHNALKWLHSFKEPKGQVARWIERLAEFNFTIEHRPGRIHGNADGLSRIHPENCEAESAADLENGVLEVSNVNESQRKVEWTTPWSRSELQLHQHEDPAIHRATAWVKKGSRPDRREIAHLGPEIGNLWSQFNRLKLENDLLFREYESEDGTSTTRQMCLPRKLIPDVLRMLRDNPTAGHFGAHENVAESNDPILLAGMAARCGGLLQTL